MVQLVRIDDRLIHGQVVVGWRRSLQFERIILSLEDVGREEWERELLRSACPEEIHVEFHTLEFIGQQFSRWHEEPVKTILLIGSIDTCRKLIFMQFPWKEINIGGIHFRAGRQEILPYVYLSDEEKVTLREMMDLGYDFFAQDLPENKKYNLKDLI